MGARDIWDVEAAGSNPVTPTTILAESRGFASTFGQFLCVYKYYDATFGKKDPVYPRVYKVDFLIILLFFLFSLTLKKFVLFWRVEIKKGYTRTIRL